MAVPSSGYGEKYDESPALMRYLHSLTIARNYKRALSNIRYYTFFVGWGRSGHSLFGSILDSHPAFAIAHELDVLPLIDAGLSRSQIFALILENSTAFATSNGGRGWSGYSYNVPNQWQGKGEDLHILGDKKGGSSTEYLTYVNKYVLKKLRTRIGVPLKVIFYHRNPFDILASSALRSKRNRVRANEIMFLFDFLAPTVHRLRQELELNELVEIYHEDFIMSPESTLKNTFAIFGEKANNMFLKNASSILKTTPHKTREKVNWDQKDIKLIEKKISTFEFFQNNYTFES